MTAEAIISFVIVTISIAPVILIGIVQYRSENPVGFWTGKEPPKKEQITDVKAYNRKHGLMWILYGAEVILCFICGFAFGGAAAAGLCMAGVIGGIFVMIAYHNKLNRTYCREGGR